MPARRLIIVGGALAIVLSAGSALIGDARGGSSTPAANATTDAVLATLDEPDGARDSQQARPGFRPRLGRHVVHAVVTVERDGQLLTFQVDQGTIDSIDDGKLTVKEAGGRSVTVGTDSTTRVRRDRKRMELTDLRAGDAVFVISRVPSGVGEPLAIRIRAWTVQAAR
jgi:hypothetical protein